MGFRKGIFGILASAMLMAPVLTSAEASIDSDKQRLEELRQQYNQRLKEIQQLRGQEKDLQKQLALLDQQISASEQLIGALQKEIEAGAARIQALEMDIKKTQDKLEVRKNMLNQRLRVMYEEGDVSYLDVLLESSDFSDFIDRMSALSLIVNQDKNLLNGIKNEKKKLDQMQANLKQEQAIRLERQNALAAAKAEQEKQKAERQTVLAQVQKERRDEEAAARREEQEINAIEAQMAAAVAAQLQVTQGKTITSSGSWLWPVPASRSVSSSYGPRWGSVHNGLDIPAPVGTPIVAVDDGIVLFSGAASGFGHWVVIKHANGLMSVYGHMYGNGIFVSAGQEVKKGQQIAAVGNDGQSTGPHLHFSVATGISGGRMNYIDPRPYVGL